MRMEPLYSWLVSILENLVGRYSAQTSSFDDLAETVAAFTESRGMTSASLLQKTPRGFSPVGVPAVVMWLVSAGSFCETAGRS